METKAHGMSNKKQNLISWVKRFGVVGFLFFLIKGLLWIVAGFWVGYSLF